MAKIIEDGVEIPEGYEVLRVKFGPSADGEDWQIEFSEDDWSGDEFNDDDYRDENPERLVLIFKSEEKKPVRVLWLDGPPKDVLGNIVK